MAVLESCKFLLSLPHQHIICTGTDRDYWSLIPAQFWHSNHIFLVQPTEFPLIFIAHERFLSIPSKCGVRFSKAQLDWSIHTSNCMQPCYMCYLWFFRSNGQSSIMPALQIWTSCSPYKPAPFITHHWPLQHTRLTCLPERLFDVQLMLCQIDIILETFQEKILG